MTAASQLEPLPALVLAAGASVRMGRPKAFLPAGRGETFLGRILSTLRRASVGPLFVVGTHGWSAEIPELMNDATLVVNPRPERGQLSSLQSGLSAAPPSRGMLIALVDVPFFTHDTTTRLVETWRRTGAEVVRPASGSRHGHPIVIGPSVMADLLSADYRDSARTVLGRYAGSTIDVYTSDPGPFSDIDTPEEYERVTGMQL